MGTSSLNHTVRYVNATTAFTVLLTTILQKHTISVKLDTITAIENLIGDNSTINSPGDSLLMNYYFPDELEDRIRLFVDYYNYQRYHESLNNLTPAGVFYGRGRITLNK